MSDNDFDDHDVEDGDEYDDEDDVDIIDDSGAEDNENDGEPAETNIRG